MGGKKGVHKEDKEKKEKKDKKKEKKKEKKEKGEHAGAGQALRDRKVKKEDKKEKKKKDKKEEKKLKKERKAQKREDKRLRREARGGFHEGQAGGAENVGLDPDHVVLDTQQQRLHAKARGKATPAMGSSPASRRRSTSPMKKASPVESLSPMRKRSAAARAPRTTSTATGLTGPLATSESQALVASAGASSSSAARGGGRVQRKKETKEEDIEPRNKWWEAVEDDAVGGNPSKSFERAKQKWFQMEHHGYLFPPDYEKHDVPLLYDGSRRIVLTYSAEELATYFAQCLGSGYDKKELFIRNFWESWHEQMTQEERDVILDFRKCDFSLIRNHLDQEREKRKARPKEEKDAEMKQKQHYTYALVNGIREKVGSYMVEPPQLFRGRGEHPLQGKLKERVSPEECILNSDPASPVPRVEVGSYPGHCWRDVIHDDSVTWLAYYHQPGRDEFKYLFLAPSSGVKGQSDLYKYEKARRLHSKIGGIRKDYRRKLTKSDDMQMKQLGTATFLIDRLALRVGGEKDTDMEADTVGCTSLRVEHLRFKEDEEEGGIKPKVTFDFLGKDSVRYLNEIEVPMVVYDSLLSFTHGKDPQDQLFDKIDPSIINEYFKEFMHDLSAKVFRTYNASTTLEEQLALFDVSTMHKAKPADLVKFYNDANKKVAVLCNHQKGVAKSHSESILKLQAKFDAQELELRATREQLQCLKKGHQRGILEGDQFTKLPTTVATAVKQIKSLKDKLQRLAHDITQKESNKNVSLSTSRINYMDPRITVAFCKRVNLEVKYIFSSTVIQKFPWALAALPDYKFRTDETIKFEDALRETRENMAKQGIEERTSEDDECGSEGETNENVETGGQKPKAPAKATRKKPATKAPAPRHPRLSVARSPPAKRRKK